MRIEVSKEWAAGVDGVAGYIRYIPHQSWRRVTRRLRPGAGPPLRPLSQSPHPTSQSSGPAQYKRTRVNTHYALPITHTHENTKHHGQRRPHLVQAQHGRVHPRRRAGHLEVGAGQGCCCVSCLSSSSPLSRPRVRSPRPASIRDPNIQNENPEQRTQAGMSQKAENAQDASG